MTMSDDELQRRVAAAFQDVMREPVPERLSSLLARGQVHDLASERAKRASSARIRLTWAQLGGMAAAVLVGIGVGWQLAPRGDALVALRDGAPVAAAGLARALDTQLAGERGAGTAVQLSFVDRGGRYCRTFTASRLAGLACRENGAWSVLAAAQADAAQAGGMRQAASGLPQAVLDAVDARISGNALDATAERQARDRGWTQARP